MSWRTRVASALGTRLPISDFFRKNLAGHCLSDCWLTSWLRTEDICYSSDHSRGRGGLSPSGERWYALKADGLRCRRLHLCFRSFAASIIIFDSNMTECNDEQPLFFSALSSMIRSQLQANLLRAIYRASSTSDDCINKSCPICLESFDSARTPTRFNCSHCVCSQCIELYRSFVAGSEKIVCPLCRKPTETYGTKTEIRTPIAPPRLVHNVFRKVPVLHNASLDRLQFNASIWLPDGTAHQVMITCASSSRKKPMIINLFMYMRVKWSLRYDWVDILGANSIYLMASNSTRESVTSDSAWIIENDAEKILFPSCEVGDKIHLQVNNAIA